MPFDDVAHKKNKEENGDEDNDDNVPPEPTNVPNPPSPPNDTLKGAEEIPDGAEEVENEDGTTTVEYTYGDTDSGQSTSRWYAGDCLSPNWSSEGDKTEDNPYDNNPYDNWPEPWVRSK